MQLLPGRRLRGYRGWWRVRRTYRDNGFSACRWKLSLGSSLAGPSSVDARVHEVALEEQPAITVDVPGRFLGQFVVIVRLRGHLLTVDKSFAVGVSVRQFVNDNERV